MCEQRRYENRRCLYGFTLIELLVVIAIIAMLLSVMVPALKKAKDHAQAVLCKSNLHQYSIGMKMYLEDNRDSFPHPELVYLNWTTYNSSQITAWGNWFCRWHHPESKWQFNGQLWPYLAAADCHMCPTFSRVANRDGCQWCGEQSGSNYIPRYSYSQNTYLGHYAFTCSYASCASRGTLKLSGVKSPSQTLMFTEENTLKIDDYNTNGMNDNVFLPSQGNGGYGDVIASYHGMKGSDRTTGKGNVLFVDGNIDLRSYTDSYQLAGPDRVRGN